MPGALAPFSRMLPAEGRGPIVQYDQKEGIHAMDLTPLDSLIEEDK